MKTNPSQARQQAKARAAMEPGLSKTTPQVAVKKSNEMRERAKIAKERPIGLKSGGPVAAKKPGGPVIVRHNEKMHKGQPMKLAEGGAAKVRKGVATPSGAPKPQPRNKNPAYR